MCRNCCVSMIGCCHNYSVNITGHFIIHLSPVPIFFCIGKIFKTISGIPPVYITERNNIFGYFHLTKQAKALAADTYTGYIQFITRGAMPKAANYITWQNRESGGRCSGFGDKIPTGDPPHLLFLFHTGPVII